MLVIVIGSLSERSELPDAEMLESDAESSRSRSRQSGSYPIKIVDCYMYM